MRTHKQELLKSLRLILKSIKHNDPVLAEVESWKLNKLFKNYKEEHYGEGKTVCQ